MENNNAIAEAIRFKITEKLGTETIENEEVKALIDEVSEVVVQMNKIFISELRRVERDLSYLSSNVSELEDRVDDHKNGVNNITINLSKEQLGGRGW